MTAETSLGTLAVQQRHLDLVERIEARFQVASWRSGDIDLWPPARMDLFLDMFRASGGDTAQPTPGRLQRAAGALATPLTNAWKSRGDLGHWRPWPRPADAILLGDGVSLDKSDGAWRDRHAEPVMAALERRGRTTFVMQPGALDRLPWGRSTFAVNTIAVHGALAASLGPKRSIDAPDHMAVLEALAQEGVQAPSLDLTRLIRRAGSIAAAASRFQRVLRAVRPRLAFAVTAYTGLGHAFALACRREGVMLVDLQHCPHEGARRAYRWSVTPEGGYSTLPAVFWTWNAEDAAHVNAFTGWDSSPWHRAIHGGHSQLGQFLDDQDPATRRWTQRLAATADASPFEREILVALQPIGGRRAVWEDLARQIDKGPTNWRWWIRRHPASTAFQDNEYQPLLQPRANVVIDEASAIPLPILLRRMSVVVSLASGAATEAAVFGVPGLFLDPDAPKSFPAVIERGQAQVIDVAEIISKIADAKSGRGPGRGLWAPPPPIPETLARLDAMAGDYRRLCQANPLERRRGG